MVYFRAISLVFCPREDKGVVCNIEYVLTGIYFNFYIIWDSLIVFVCCISKNNFTVI